MKHWIVILLILIMAILELRIIERFNITTIFKKREEFTSTCNLDLKKDKIMLNPRLIPTLNTDWTNEIIRENPEGIPIEEQCACERFTDKPKIWIFNEVEKSARFWKDFYSRRSFQETSGIIDLCLQSIYKHNSDRFDIMIFNQCDLEKLLPEYFKHPNYFKQIKNDYVYYNLIKYAILYKYGGYWIPADTIMMSSLMDTRIYFNRGYILTFGSNNTNFIDCKGFNDSYLAALPENKIIGDMLKFITDHISSFQNAINFKESINRYFNAIICSHKKHYHYDMLIEKSSDNKYITIDWYFKTYYNSLNDKVEGMLPLYLGKINRHSKYNYLNRMSPEQILNSDMLIGNLLRKSLSG